MPSEAGYSKQWGEGRRERGSIEREQGEKGEEKEVKNLSSN